MAPSGILCTLLVCFVLYMFCFLSTKQLYKFKCFQIGWTELIIPYFLVLVVVTFFTVLFFIISKFSDVMFCYSSHMFPPFRVALLCGSFCDLYYVIIYFFSCRNIREDASADAGISNGDDQSIGESPSKEKAEVIATEFENVSAL